MRGLLFLSKAAFICNIFFLACVVLRYKDITSSQELKGFLIIMGWIVAPVLSVIVNLWRANLLLKRRESPVPRWLAAVNMAFFFFQLIFFFM